MKTALLLIARQLPWEKVINVAVDMAVDRFKRGKIKKLPTQELLKNPETRLTLTEINRRIKAKNGGVQ